MKTNLPKYKEPEAFGKSHASMEKSKKEEQEFGPGKESIGICRDCGAMYYNKSWHHNLRNYKQLDEDKKVNFFICPACKMIGDQKFEGQAILENVPENLLSEAVRNIENTGERAYKRDPMDRIIKIKKQKSKTEGTWNVEVLATENQLARNIARQIEKAFKGSGSNVKWSRNESTARIVVRFI